MGLISKLEDKLSGNKSEQQQYDDDRTNTTGTGSGLTSSNTTTGGSSRQHPISSGREGSGITGGTAVDNNNYGQQTSSIPGSFPGSNTTGSNTGYSNVQTSRIPDRTRDEYKTNNPEEEKLLRNIPGYAAATGNHPGTNTSTGATTHHTTTSTHPTSTLGSSNIGSSTDHNTPRQPYDPYSSKGQQIAANAANNNNSSTLGSSNNNTTSHSTLGSSNIGSGRDYDNSSVPRTSGGGITNQTTELRSGPHSEMENRDAVPVAGGQKIGTGAAYDSPSQGVGPGEAQQHHYGRDAAVAGTAGAAGYGASSHGRQDETSTSTAGPHKSNLLNKLDPRVDSDNSKAYDNQTSGTTGYGSQTTGTTGSTTHPSSTTGYGNQSNTTGYGNQTSGTTQDHHYGRDAALAGGAGTAAYGASSHGNQHDSRTHQTDTSSSTAGPHKSDMLNKLDPRVDSDNSKAYSSQQGTTGYGNQTGSNTTSGYGSHPSTTTGTQDQHHYGRDAALVGGAGALGAGAAHNHNSSRNNNQDISYMKGTSADQPLSSSRDFNDRHGNTSTGYGNNQTSSTTTGPHNSSMLNKLDPRVDSDNSKSTSGHGSSGNEYSEAGALTGSHSSRHQYSGGNQSATTTGGETKAGWDAAKRLGGAYGAGYEAGYRDALAHAEADRLAGR